MSTKQKGLTENIWGSLSPEQRMYWGLLVTLLTYISNYSIGVSENVYVNNFVSLLVTIYVTIVVNAERDFENFLDNSKHIIFKISWMVPTFLVCGLLIFVLAFFFYALGLVVFPIYAEPLKDTYPEALIKGSFVLIILWTAKKKIVDKQVLPNTYKILKNALIPLFSTEGKSTIAAFVLFELTIIFISTMLTYSTFEIFDAVMTGNFSVN